MAAAGDVATLEALPLGTPLLIGPAWIEIH